MRLSIDEKPTSAPSACSARAMPQAIEWSFATPKISAFLPSSRPISMHLSMIAARRGQSAAYHRPMAGPTAARRPSARALAGVRALLLDLDGVIVVAGAGDPRRRRRARHARATGAIPYRIVTNTSAVSRATLARWASQHRGPDPGRALPVRPVGVGGVDGATRSRTRRCTSSPPRMPGREFAGQRLLTHEEAVGPRGDGGRRDHRRLARGGHLRQPEPRVPARPRRGRARRHAPQPVVAHARRPDARLRRVRRRPRVRGRRSRPDHRQASPRRSSALAVADLRREAGPRPRARDDDRDGRRRRSHATSGRPNAPACAASSCCPASTPADVEAAAAERGGRRPDAIAPSLADVVAALD